jgi:hypothetical protein
MYEPIFLAAIYGQITMNIGYSQLNNLQIMGINMYPFSC